MTLQIRPATTADAGACAALYNHYVANSAATLQEKPATANDFCQTIQNAETVFLCAEQNNNLRGYCYAAPFKTRCGYRGALEVSIYVAPDKVGGGVGGALMRGLLAALEKTDARKLIAVLSLPNDKSAAFHEKFGFVHCGTLPAIAVKFGKTHDSGYWLKSLTD